MKKVSVKVIVVATLFVVCGFWLNAHAASINILSEAHKITGRIGEFTQFVNETEGYDWVSLHRDSYAISSTTTPLVKSIHGRETCVGYGCSDIYGPVYGSWASSKVTGTLGSFFLDTDATQGWAGLKNYHNGLIGD